MVLLVVSVFLQTISVVKAHIETWETGHAKVTDSHSWIRRMAPNIGDGSQARKKNRDKINRRKAPAAVQENTTEGTPVFVSICEGMLVLA